MKYIIGNWKMHGSADLLEEWINEIPETANKVGLCPPSALLALPHKKVWWGAQNIFEEEKGAFTGEVSASIVRSVGVDFVLVGHSERRHVFKETNVQCGKKVQTALKNGLKVILCVGETKQERDQGKTLDVLRKQLSSALKGFHVWDRLLIAYEPVWAIGTGDTATPKEAANTHEKIKEMLSELGGSPPILYGGSVNENNARELLQQDGIDGVLVGGASLNPKGFRKIVESYP